MAYTACLISIRERSTIFRLLMSNTAIIAIKTINTIEANSTNDKDIIRLVNGTYVFIFSNTYIYLNPHKAITRVFTTGRYVFLKSSKFTRINNEL